MTFCVEKELNPKEIKLLNIYAIIKNNVGENIIILINK